MDTLYIVIPAYNESENIKRTIEEWCPVVEKHNGGGLARSEELKQFHQRRKPRRYV